MEIQEIVLKTLRSTGEELEIQNLINANETTKIYSATDGLDSLGLVNFISDLEMMLGEELGVDVLLADERAMSAKNSPFRDVKTLVDYIKMLIDEQKEA